MTRISMVSKKHIGGTDFMSVNDLRDFDNHNYSSVKDK